MKVDSFPYNLFDDFIQSLCNRKFFVTDSAFTCGNISWATKFQNTQKIAKQKTKGLPKTQQNTILKNTFVDEYKNELEAKNALIDAVWLWTYPIEIDFANCVTSYFDGVKVPIQNICTSHVAGSGGSKSQKPDDILFILKWMEDIVNSKETDISNLKDQFVQSYKNNTEKRLSKNLLLHLCSPDSFEPIGVQDNKTDICDTFRCLLNNQEQTYGIDDKLIALRNKLFGQFGIFPNSNGFYDTTISQMWGYKGNKTGITTNILKLAMINEHKKILLKSNNLILTGAPGTGKTYLAKEIAKAMTGDNEAHYEMVQFHPSYDYSDFVEGLRPVKNANGNIGFERKNGVFKAFCKKALDDGYTMTEEGWKYKGEKAPKYVFIIDEINRGEMSKIFGELFFSIDPGYRGTDGRINTQYQNLVDKEYDGNGNEVGEDVFKEGFFVPKNVYIIGTMNDIDRSVESMDFAMRRRFAFKEVRATDRETMLDEKISDDTIRNEAINRMRNVNYRIQTIEGLNEAYHIGPAYFGKIEGDNFTELWNNHIKGLLYEYLRGIPNAKEFLDSLERAFKEKEPYVTINNNGDLELDASKSEDWKNKIVNKQ